MPRPSQRPTIRDVAKAAGVSTATVSYVMNGTVPVTPSTHERVLAVIERLGYRPSGLARSLAGRATRTVGVMTPPITGSSEEYAFSQILKGISQALWRSRYTLVLSPITGGAREDLPQVPPVSAGLFRDKGADGLILFAEDEPSTIRTALDEGLPVACVGPAPAGIAWVGTDHRMASRLAVDHLAGLGHLEIACIAAKTALPAGGERLRGYVESLGQRKLPVEPEWIITTEPTIEGGFQAMDRLLSLGARPSGVICHSDAMALGAIRAARNKGVSIPDDIALVSSGDEPFASYSEPALTTVREPLMELGIRVTELLLRQLETGPDSGAPTDGVLLAPKLVIRESCGSLRWM